MGPYGAQVGLKLETVLPPPSPRCWDYRCEPSHLATPQTKLAKGRGAGGGKRQSAGDTRNDCPVFPL